MVASPSIKASRAATSAEGRRANFGRLKTSRYSASTASETNNSTARKATRLTTSAWRPCGLTAAEMSTLYRSRSEGASSGGVFSFLVAFPAVGAFLESAQGGDQVVVDGGLLLLLVVAQSFPDEFAQGPVFFSGQALGTLKLGWGQRDRKSTRLNSSHLG